MANHTSCADFSERSNSHLEATRSLSQESLRAASQPHYDRVQPSPRKSRSLSPHQTADRPTGAPRQKAHAQNHEEQITLLPSGNEEPSLSEDLRGGNHLPSSAYSEKDNNAPAVTLHRSGYVVFMVLIYSSLALTAWVLICLLTFNPITLGSYGFDNRIPNSESFQLRAKYAKSEKIYGAARTLQAVVSVLTIPLTSAVCSATAVVFTQFQKRATHLTMRQMVTLADKGWTDPKIIWNVLTGRGKQQISSLLIFALLLNIFGASITPLQTIFLAQETIKTPTRAFNQRDTFARVFDIPDRLKRSDESQAEFVTMLTRRALESTSNLTPQPRLWQENFDCSFIGKGNTEQCIYDTATLGNLSALSNPFLAQLPVGYHTGLVKQFIPRINSTVKWESIPRKEMPVNCGDMPNSFYAHYANGTRRPEDSWDPLSGAQRNWSIEACMPDNQSVSPWQQTYMRQSFTEVLYLNISVIGYHDWRSSAFEVPGPDSTAYGGIFRIISETTAGYFELPNYMRRGQAGPIIDGDPDGSDHCGFDCDEQVSRRSMVEARTVSPVSNFQSNGSLDLTRVANKGPLLTIAMALFGYDSFIPVRLNDQSSFLRGYDSWLNSGNESRGRFSEYSSACREIKPMSSLLLEPFVGHPTECNQDVVRTPEDLDEELAKYVQSFYFTGPRLSTDYQDPERSTNAFASAVYLANEAWLTSDWFLSARRAIYSDPGADTTIPSISRAGIILISSLWAVYLSCLLSLAVYSAKAPRWTNQLDAFAMIRIGATTDERISLDVGFEAETIDALDEMPGFVGDATGGEGEVGVLGMGAPTPLDGVRPYKCYMGDEKAAFRRAQRRFNPFSGIESTHIKRDGRFSQNHFIEEQ